jgi:hypothetical protein
MNPFVTIRLLAGLALASSLVACGAESNYTVTADQSRAQTINRTLYPYFQEFVDYYGRAVQQIPLHIGPLEQKVAGKCYIPGQKSAGDQIADSMLGDSSQKARRILINVRFWERNKDNHDAIQNVVFHELGHCILNRGHTKKMMRDAYGNEIPNSIMYPSEFGVKPFYRENFAHYVHELFHPAPGSPGVKGSAGSLDSPDEWSDDVWTSAAAGDEE